MISVLLLLAACSTSTDGPDGDPGTDVDSGSDVETPSTTAMIDATGGTLSLEMVTVDIPAGALTDATEITLTVAGDSGDADALTPIFELEPHGQVFTEPVTLTFDVAEGPAQVVRSDDDTTYLPLATEHVAGGVEVDVDGFSWFYVTNPASLCDGCLLTRTEGAVLGRDEYDDANYMDLVAESSAATFTATAMGGDRIRLIDGEDRCLAEVNAPTVEYDGTFNPYDAMLVPCARIPALQGPPDNFDIYPDLQLVSNGSGSVRIVSGTGRCLTWVDVVSVAVLAFMDCGYDGVRPEGWNPEAPPPRADWDLAP